MRFGDICSVIDSEIAALEAAQAPSPLEKVRAEVENMKAIFIKAESRAEENADESNDDMAEWETKAQIEGARVQLCNRFLWLLDEAKKKEGET